jgi:Holliday junction resolvase
VEIRPEILDPYLAKAAVDQLAADYSQRGFKVERDVRLGDTRADLIAKKGDELIVFEVKSGKWTPEEREAVKRLRNQAVHDRGRFVLVLAQQPSGKLVEIEGLEDLLTEIVADRCQSELSELSTHTRIVGVTDVDLASVTIGTETIEVRGSASVELELQYGSDSDLEREQGFTSYEVVPLEFHLTLDLNRELREVLNLRLDLDGLLE